MTTELFENTGTIEFDNLLIKQAVNILRAANHDLRQEIVELIDANGRLTVTEVYNRLKLEQSVVSQHLALLRRAGIVKTERDGKFIYYSVNRDRIEEVHEILRRLV